MMLKKMVISLSLLSLSMSLTGCGTNNQGAADQMNKSSAYYANESVRSFDVRDLDDRLTYNPGQTSYLTRTGNTIVLRSDSFNRDRFGTAGTQSSRSAQNRFELNENLTAEEASQIIQNIALGNIRIP